MITKYKGLSCSAFRVGRWLIIERREPGNVDLCDMMTGNKVVIERADLGDFLRAFAALMDPSELTGEPRFCEKDIPSTRAPEGGSRG